MSEFMEGSVGIFSVSFILAVFILSICAFGITMIIRKVLKMKYQKELEFSKLAYDELETELFSDNWIALQQLVKQDDRVAKAVEKQYVEQEMNRIEEVLNGCSTIVTSLQDDGLETYGLKEITSVLTYANDVIEAEKEKVDALNGTIEQLLIQAKYGNRVPASSMVLPEAKASSHRTVLANQNALPTATKVMDKKETVISNREEKQMEYSKTNNEHFENVEGHQATPRTQEYGETSVFAKGLVIDGNVSVDTSLIIKGEVRGNVICKQDVEVSEGALITGDISAGSLSLRNSKVVGDVNVSGDVLIGDETYVKGNVYAKSLEINGSLEGNVKVQSTLSFTSEAKVLGDISAMYIDIEKGAQISGSMNIGEGASDEIEQAV